MDGVGGVGGPDGGTDATNPTHFSFFATSLKALQELSNNSQGFGGDLRFGETGAGAGLRGADKLCATIAERSLKGAGSKPWRAFLSAVAGEDGTQVNAIDRIGEGPWYDRLGRTLALTKADLLFDRPRNADSAIGNDFPNEDGVPNHRPDATEGQVDNQAPRRRALRRSRRCDLWPHDQVRDRTNPTRRSSRLHRHSLAAQTAGAGGGEVLDRVKPMHLPDVTVQLHAARRAGLAVERAEVMHLNSECRHPDLRKLFVRKAVTKTVGPHLRAVPKRAGVARRSRHARRRGAAGPRRRVSIVRALGGATMPPPSHIPPASVRTGPILGSPL